LKENESSSSANPSIEALFKDKSMDSSDEFYAPADFAPLSMSKEEDTASSAAVGLEQGVIIPEALLTSYPWVHRDVLATPSVFTKEQEAHLNEVVQIFDDLEHNKLYRIVVPVPGERPCFMATEGNRYMFMFDYTLTTIGVCLPFSDFTIGLINHLRLAPSQIHPVAWGFIRSFELVCSHYGIPASVPVFMYLFDLIRKGGENNKSFVSLRGSTDRRVFKAYTDSAKRSDVPFSVEYYKIMAELEDGDPKKPKMICWDDPNLDYPKFYLYWTSSHFDLKASNYYYTYDRLSSEEKDIVDRFVASMVGNKIFECRKILDASPSSLNSVIGIIFVLKKTLTCCCFLNFAF